MSFDGYGEAALPAIRQCCFEVVRVYRNLSLFRLTKSSVRGILLVTKAALLSENRLCDRGEGSMALLMMICAAISGASCTMSGADLAVGTADALHAAPLFFSDVPNRKADDQYNDRNYDNAIHKTAPLRELLLQCVLSGQGLIGLADQGSNHSRDGGDHDQAGQEALADGSGGDQGADLIDQVSDGLFQTR